MAASGGRDTAKRFRPQKILAVNGRGGLVAIGQINGHPLKFLIDTGAAVTLVSKEIFHKFQMKSELQPSNLVICGADGKNLDVSGEGTMEITLGPLKVTHEVIVAALQPDAILGMDFLSQHECKVDIPAQRLIINSLVVNLWQEGNNPQSCKVAIKEPVVIPPESEKLILGEVQRRGSEGPVNMVQGSAKFVERYGLFVCHSLVDVEKGVVPIRILNPQSEPVHLHKGTMAGLALPVDICQTDMSPNYGVYQIGQQDAEVPSARIKTLPEHLQMLLEESGGNLCKEENDELKEFLVEYNDVFVGAGGQLGRTGLVKHSINTGNQYPIRQRPRRTPLHLQDEVKKQVTDMLEQGVIEPSNSPWSSPIVLVRKKDGSYRFCVDYRLLNKATIGDAYPIPRVNFDQLAGSQWFSTLDLMSGYWQVEMDPNDKPKTAFACQEGLFQFNLMPFGLTNAPSTFERLMESVLTGLQYQTCLIYLDDVIVYSNSFHEGISRLREVCERFRQAGLKLKAKKCVLFQTEVKYLGHIVSRDGVATDPVKIKAVKEWPTPTSVTQVRSFLGLAAYYRRFIKDFSKIAAPLHQLTEKNQKFSWADECNEAFNQLKESLTTTPVLAYPVMGKQFILDCDASDIAIGAVLSQVNDNIEHVIAYGSKCLSKAERRYCVTRRELLAIVYFVKYFRHYLYGVKFLIRTDHGSLRWLFNFKEPEGQVARWIETLSTFQFDIQHRPGKQHGNADGMSRIPCKQCQELHSDVRAISLQEEEKRNVETQPENTSWIVGWTSEFLRKEQLEDPIIGKILTMKESCDERPQWKDISEGCKSMKAYWFLWKQFHVRSGVLYKLWEEEKAGKGVWQIVLPASLREEVLLQLHDHVTAGHLGQHKTLAKVRQRFYWHGLKEYVHKWCNGCNACASAKGPSKKPRALLQQCPVGCPMERVALDIIGPLPTSHKGNKYVLVVADCFTRWTEAYALPNQEAVTIAEKLVTEFVCRFGAPMQILTDQGRQFESKLFAEICTLLDIDKTRTSSFHPQTNGLVERFNRTLEGMLRPFVSHHQQDWDEYLPMLLMAYRSTPQESSSISPNCMMLGHEINLPIDLMFPIHESNHLVDSEYASTLQERLQRAHENARLHLRSAAMRQKKLYDLKASPSRYKRGDFVWLYTPQKKKGISPKLQKFWSGPYLIVHKLSDALYRIQKSVRTIPKIVHFNRLKRYHGKGLVSWVPGADPGIEILTQDAEEGTPTGPRPPDLDTDSENEDVISQDSEIESEQPIMPDLQMAVDSNCEFSHTPCPNPSIRRSKRVVQRPKRLIEEI